MACVSRACDDLAQVRAVKRSRYPVYFLRWRFIPGSRATNDANPNRGTFLSAGLVRKSEEMALMHGTGKSGKLPAGQVEWITPLTNCANSGRKRQTSD